MENCRSKCGIYTFVYFFSVIIGTAFALLYAFGIIPILTFGVVGIIAIGAAALLVTFNARLTACAETLCSCFPFCVLKHLAVEAALTVFFGFLTIVFAGILIAAAIFLGLAVAAFVATIISATSTVFYGRQRCEI